MAPPSPPPPPGSPPPPSRPPSPPALPPSNQQLVLVIRIANHSALSESISATDLSAQLKSAAGGDAFVDIVIEQASELFIEYNESIVADTVLAAVETLACANTTSTSCVVTFTVQRRRALAQMVALTLTRALAGSERVKFAPSFSTADLAAALGVDGSAVVSVKPPAVKSVRVVAVLDMIEEQDKTQLLEAIALLFDLDPSTITTTVTSQFPPSPPSPAPSEPGKNVTSRLENEAGNSPPAWLVVILGVAAALLAVLACVYCYCRKRRGVRVYARNPQSSSVKSATRVRWARAALRRSIAA